MHRKSSLQVISSLSLLLLALIMQSCGSREPTLVPTQVSTLTLAPLDYVRCSQVTPIPFQIAKKPKVIYVLIDRSGSYGAYTKAAVDVLIEGLALSIEPADRLNLIWLGAYEDDSRNWLVETVPEIGFPLLAPSIPTYTPSPIPPPTSTPTEIPAYIPEGVLDEQAFKQTATVQAGYWTVTSDASSIIATNTAIQVEKDINQQQCDQTKINNQNQKLIDNWQRQRKQVVEDFVKKTIAPLKGSAQEGSDLATHIYNSLYYAARTIRQEKDTNLFRAYYLIILSDMDDAGSLNGESLSVDLTDVHTLMAMVYCEPSIVCQNRSNDWELYFRDRGAILPSYPFRLVDETTPYVISDFLK